MRHSLYLNRRLLHHILPDYPVDHNCKRPERLWCHYSRLLSRHHHLSGFNRGISMQLWRAQCEEVQILGVLQMVQTRLLCYPSPPGTHNHHHLLRDKWKVFGKRDPRCSCEAPPPCFGNYGYRCLSHTRDSHGIDAYLLCERYGI